MTFFLRRAGAWRLSVVLAAVSLLAACAVQPPDDGAARIDEYLAERHVPRPDPEQHLEVAGEISREQAVLLALARHPAVRREYLALNIAAADVVAASELSNPSLGLSVTRPEGGGGTGTGIGIAQNFAGLLLRPARMRMADAQYEQAALRIGSAVQQLATETEAAWFWLVTQEQALAVRELETRASVLRAELAGRFHGAGNLSAMELAALRRDAAQAQLDEIAARRARSEARAVLAQWLDAPVQAEWSVPALLPVPAHHEPSAASLTEMALSRRLDLAALRLDQQLFADNLALARRYRWLGELSVGVEHERESDGGRNNGLTLGIGLPLLHRNPSAVLRAEALQQQAAAEQAELEMEVGHQVRALHATLLLTRRAFAVQRDEWLPELSNVVARRQERVNFMLDGIFTLLDDKQQELAAWRQQVLTLGDYWQIRTQLSRVVGSGLPLMSGDGVLDTRPLDHGEAPPAHSHGASAPSAGHDHAHGGHH